MDDLTDTQDRAGTLRLKPAHWILIAILIVAALTRLIHLGQRVMSHDEINHVYFAWLWFDGGSYQHNPVSHGPLQFHLLNLSYVLFGDNDISARLPAAFAGIAAVALAWSFRKWFTDRGALAAAVLLTFSPFMLYYGRYARNEMFVVVETMVTLLAIFRYLESRGNRWLYLLAAAMALHAATKETFYIHTAQWLIFLTLWFFAQLLTRSWPSPRLKPWFASSVILGGFGWGLALVEFLRERSAAGEAAVPLTSSLVFIGAALGTVGIILAAILLIRTFGVHLREDFPILDVLVIMATLILPLLAALPAQALGWDPMNYSDNLAISRTTAIVLVMLAVSIGIGLFWDRRRWLIAAGIFAVIYIPLYTTLFSNPFGLFSGLVGSLGYWLVQQGVERGGQPWFYYALIQIPLYEFLPAIGAIFGSFLVILQPGRLQTTGNQESGSSPLINHRRALILFLIYSALSTLVIYSYAGERMPWITVHLTLPMILLTGYWFGAVFPSQSLRRITSLRGVGMFSLGLVIFLALGRGLGYVSGIQPAVSTVHQGVELATGWLLPIALIIIAVLFMRKLAKPFSNTELLELGSFVVVSLLLVQTIRTGFRAAYVNHDSAKEYMVYAHAAPGPKWALSIVEELSQRTTGGFDLPVGYDNDAAYPFWWYFRNYPKALAFGAEPNRTIREYPVVFASDANAPRYEAYLGDDYKSMSFERLWWPREDYTSITWQTVKDALIDPQMRRALWDIWYDRDFDRYSQLTGHDVSARGWQPASRMKMYVRKDYAAGILGFVEPVEQEWTWTDLYVDQMVDIEPGLILGGSGSSPGAFSAPRGLAVDPAGMIYIADSNNHRIQVLSPTGELQRSWGAFADFSAGEPPPGSFNQPWDLALASDGSVIVVDTWNHRVQRFNSLGESEGIFETTSDRLTPAGLYGPRAVAIDGQDRVFVVDTGNKRVLIFSLEGTLLNSFGSGGLGLGNLDEPVGIGVDRDGKVWIADTWNRRVQAFDEIVGSQFEAVTEWLIDGWYSQSIENKPYLAISPQGHICVTDPEGGRVLCFTQEGEFQLGFTGGGMILPSGIAFDSACRIWVSDAGSDRILRFDTDLCES